MQKFSLTEPSFKFLEKLPETGMGFQLVEASVMGSLKRMLVFNCETAFDISDLDLTPGGDPSAILRNGFRIMELLNERGPVQTMIMSPQPSGFRLLETRIAGLSAVVPSGPPIAVLPSSLVKHVPSLPSKRLFHRFSAFKPDRRVDPVTGDFLPGTYAAPDSEKPFVMTGFVAVGRFALPNTLPASNNYQIEAKAGTAVSFGTVGPAFGQSGGGVEAFFASGAINVQSPAIGPLTIPDE
jgi:hypothetical protein